LKSQLSYYINKYDSKFSLTLDGWTASPNQNAYFGITIHFINRDWEIESKLLDIIDLNEKHSGKYLFRVLKEALEDFEIQNRIFRYVNNFDLFI
jgi:hypothetical protein